MTVDCAVCVRLLNEFFEVLVYTDAWDDMVCSECVTRSLSEEVRDLERFDLGRLFFFLIYLNL